MNTAVKPHVLACLVLVTASAALAQHQPAEWRPSIAEDNKAATLDDTLKFVVGTANNPSVNQVVFQADKTEGGSQEMLATFGVLSAAKCSIEWSTLSIADGISAIVYRRKYIADLAKVDPLSIAVTPNLDVGSVHGFMVVLSGTSGNPFADVMGYGRDGGEVHKGILRRPAEISEAESAPASCEGYRAKRQKACKITQDRATRTELFLADQEAAHRVARALMHAALLCGGAKAVSPF